MTFDTTTEVKPSKFKSSGISEKEIEARRARREQVEADPEVTEIVTKTHPELLDSGNDERFEIYRKAVIDAIVSTEIPAPTEEDKPGYNPPDQPGPLERRWESWFTPTPPALALAIRNIG